ncbi:hypothetical protein Pfo_031038 [Paulownia fortunei]|nr:hypothetical protein Pfo_031038 [Paulownia fortunei]
MWRALTHPKLARKSAATLHSRKMCVILYSMLQRITFVIEGNLESVSLPPTNQRAVRSKPHSPPQSRVLLCPFQKLAQVHETMPQVQLPCLCILIPYESTNARRTWVTISRPINMHFELIQSWFLPQHTRNTSMDGGFMYLDPHQLRCIIITSTQHV